MGMSYELYWYGDVWAVVDFRNADKIRFERKNQDFWIQGMYFYEVLSDFAPILVANPRKNARQRQYSKKPYDFDREKDGQEQQEREKQEALRAMVYMQNMERAGKSWGKAASER